MTPFRNSQGKKFVAACGSLATFLVLAFMVAMSIHSGEPAAASYQTGSSAFAVTLYTGETVLLDVSKMHVPRQAYSSTAIPDGSILFLGGRDARGSLISAPEAFNPGALAFGDVKELTFTPRSEHTATLLTDGRILVAGGRAGDGPASASTLLIDTVTWEVLGGPKLATGRKGHSARLLASGAVVLEGGVGADGNPVANPEIIDVRTGKSELYTDVLQLENETRFQSSEPMVAEIIPPHEARGVDLRSYVAIRFTRAIDSSSLNDETLTLFGPTGVVKCRIVPAENGMLAFIVPEASLAPASRYTVFIKGATDLKGLQIPFTVSSFTTLSIVASTPFVPVNPIVGTPTAQDLMAKLRWKPAAPSSDRDMWVPNNENVNSGGWFDNRPLEKRALASPPNAAEGVTALSGRVLLLSGAPLAGVSVKLGDVKGHTDANGAFLLRNVKAGKGTLEVDGATANHDDARFGSYLMLTNTAEGKTTPLGYDIWMAKLDPQGDAKISSPTTQETILTTPAIPGLEIHIPAGTVIRDRDGNVVTEVNITALPVNRPPFPLPNLGVPVFFTVQPGGAWLQGVDVKSSKGGQVYYPNYKKALPHAPAQFWDYDPYGKGWYIYGPGAINATGTQAVPDLTTVIYQFTGAMWDVPPVPPLPGPPPTHGCSGDTSCGGPSSSGVAGSESGGEPVSLSTGFFIRNERDLFVSDVIPIAMDRTYRSQDPSSRTFGFGWTSFYDMLLYSQNPYQEVDLILPDGGRVHFVRIVPGLDYSDAVLESTAPGMWYKARVQHNSPRFGWDLIFRDGSRWFFHEYGPIREITDVAGNTLVVTRRDSNGDWGPMTRIESPNGRYVDFTLDGSGRTTQAMDNVGRTFTYAYDGAGRLSTVTDPLSNTRIYTYDTNNRLITVQDPNGHVVVTNQYDTNGRVTQQTLADSNTFQFAYTLSSGRVTQTDVTDQRSKVRRVSFDTNGYISSSTAAYGTVDARTTSFGRDASSQVTSITDPLGRVTAMTYDGFGNVTGITRLYGTVNAVTTSYTYSSLGERLLTLTDPLSHTTTLTYDSRRNLLTVTDPLGHTVTYSRDAEGRTLTMTDALSHTWTYTYNGADLASFTDPLSRTTQFFTDGLGRTVRVIDPLGNTTLRDYDAMDRLTQSIDALGGATQFGVDANGDLTSHKDQKNNQTTYTFNNLSLVSGKTDALNNTEAYLYGANGLVSRITDRKGQISGISYDNLDRVSQLGFGATAASPTAFTSTIGYTYDAGDRATQIADSANGNITRTYDGFDRLTQEVTPEGTVSYTHDDAGRRATMTVAAQGVVAYTWDNADRLTQIQQGTDVIAFAYDSANRRTSTTLANGVAMAYAYDNANQLSSITYTKGATTIGDLQYAYDNAGRRIQVSGSLASTDLPAAVTSAAYNANNQLTGWAGTTQTYDLNGNLTGDGTNTYTWDARDLLTGISGGATASFSYDGIGRRKSKTVAGTQTGFLYDGSNYVQELSGVTPTANLIVGGIDELFQRKDAAATGPIVDAIGTVIGLTDASGALQTQYSYQPYGKTILTGISNGNSQTYTGREDDGTGLFYYRARYYSPVTGRFVAEDSIGIDAGANFYNYVENDPINWADPTGHLMGWWTSNRRDVGQEAGMQVGMMGNAAATLGLAGTAVAGTAVVGYSGRAAYLLCPPAVQDTIRKTLVELFVTTVMASGAGNGGNPDTTNSSGKFDPSSHRQREDRFRTDPSRGSGGRGFGRPR